MLRVQRRPLPNHQRMDPSHYFCSLVVRCFSFSLIRRPEPPTVISALYYCLRIMTTTRQRRNCSKMSNPSATSFLVAAILIVLTTFPCTLSYKVNLPKATRPHIQTRLSEHKKEHSSHEETYALRRPPKKRSSASKVAMTSAVIDHNTIQPPPTFERRMRNMVLGDEKKRKKPRAAAANLPRNVQMITTLEDYKHVVGDEREKIVVARFYAPWCKVRLYVLYCCA